MATQSNYAQDRQRDSEGSGGSELYTRRNESIQKEVNLKYRSCPNCSHAAKEVIYAAQKERSGWYCERCQIFIEANEPEERKL